MTAWEDVLDTALVGTERRPFDAAGLAALVDAPVLDVERAEARVLAAAAVMAAYRRAGRLPARLVGELPDAAPLDDRPPCSQTALQILSVLLSGMVEGAGGTDELVGEWLTACAARGRRVPSPSLVPLLEVGTARPTLRGRVAAVAGPRGAWLAARNPEWAWALPKPPDPPTGEVDLADRYATASRAERIALLRDLRACDREAARHLLLSTWTSEPAADRTALLAILAPDLGDDDEPLLEDVLDDRAGSVRAAAAGLLDRLPRSRRAERMAERAAALVSLEGRSRRRISVDLPDAIDAAARRDGISDRREAGTGLKAAWLTQIVGSAPLYMWGHHLSVAPDEAVALAADHPELRAGWRQAAIVQRDQVWAAALLAREPDRDLVAVLATAAAIAYVEGIVRRSSVPHTCAVAVLAAVPGPWPTELSCRVVQRLAAAPRELISVALPVVSTRLDPSVLPAVEAWMDRVGDESLRRDIGMLVHALSLRQTITQEFA